MYALFFYLAFRNDTKQLCEANISSRPPMYGQVLL